jgi:hypothetical protein
MPGTSTLAKRKIVIPPITQSRIDVMIPANLAEHTQEKEPSSTCISRSA